MNYILENDLLKVSINSLGAEVKSIVRKNNGKEIWWTGNKQYWEGSSLPVAGCGMESIRSKELLIRCRSTAL